MDRIAVITACWQRPDVFELFLRNMAALDPAPVVLCAGSPGDRCEKLARRFNVLYRSVPNRMGPKWNYAASMARLHPAQYYLFMGSDDLMDQRCWDYYQRYDGQHLALLDYYFYNLPTHELAYWPGYRGPRAGEPIGAGKLVRADVLADVNYRPFQEHRPNALDHDMHHTLTRRGWDVDVVPMKATGGISLDLKGPGNATRWETITGIPYVRMEKAGALKKLSPFLWKLVSIQPR